MLTLTSAPEQDGTVADVTEQQVRTHGKVASLVGEAAQITRDIAVVGARTGGFLVGGGIRAVSEGAVGAYRGLTKQPFYHTSA